jgi:pyruvate/2-oxoglutarate dehydrogenase complex dihydrolipoamide dehydrogenase (E3) component
MTSPSHYEALIIGSGQAGTPLASAFAKAGRRTALIERSHIGGCCVNEGCTPTKTLIASGRVAYLTRRAQDYGIHTQDIPGENKVLVDMEKVRERKRNIVNSFRGGSEKRIAAAGVDILIGTGKFIDPGTVKVSLGNSDEKIVTADQIFLNVGERPVVPELEGLDKIDSKIILDSTSIQELDFVPGHLVVLGGGYVGVEFGQLFRRLGARITILQRGNQLLPREDPEVAASLLDILKEDGLEVLLESTSSSIRPYSGGFILEYETATSQELQSVSGTHILFAAGRVPNTDVLNLTSAGINTDRKGYVVTDEFLETSVPNIYALGDAKGPPAFTHISYDDYRIVVHNQLTASESATKLSTTDRLVPYVVYTDPQLGHIGLHEKEAKARYPGKKILTANMPMSYVARALETDESRGMMKAVVDEETGLILGFTCLGIEGGEVMSVVQMAMMGRVRWEVLRDAVWAHPSLAESLNNLWAFLK